MMITTSFVKSGAKSMTGKYANYSSVRTLQLSGWLDKGSIGPTDGGRKFVFLYTW